MASLFGSSKKVTQTQTPDLYLRYSSSLQNRPKAIGWGRNRVAGNCTWYAGFNSYLVGSYGGSSGGGKGGLFGSSSQSQPTYTVNYSVSVIFSIGDGPITGLVSVYENSTVYDPVAFGGALFAGSYAQTPWGFVATNYPAQALAYRGEAYYAMASLGLGTSSSLPTINFEVQWLTATAAAGNIDANPADVVTDFLTNPGYGVSGWPAGLLGDLTQYALYCQAMGLFVSPLISDQTAGNTWLQDLATVTNSEFRWSSGLLSIVPYADANETGNGATFIAPVTPVYNLTADDFLVNQGSLGQGSLSGDTPIVISRKPRADMVNHVRGEFLDRTNYYNSNTVETWDEASVIAYGDRPSDMLQCHQFCLASAASQSIALQLARQQIAAQYQFTVDRSFGLVDPMDILTLTEPSLGLVAQPVRITEIQENDDWSLTMTADEYLGSVTAPLYARQPNLGTQTNYNITPGPINAPLLFEPPYQLAGDLEMWAAVSGQNLATWGGCYVYASSDGATYNLVGQVQGPARMGVTTADLPPIGVALIGQTIDAVHPLSVDLTESGGTLGSGSQSDMLAGNTAIYIGGEVIAYQTATLNAANKYTLGPLYRGAYDTNIADHPAGTPIARLDKAIFKYPYTSDRIGSTIFLKFQSFNTTGGGLQDLSTVGAVPYTITGSPLAATLPPPSNLRTVFTAGFQQLAWDEVQDFRAGIRYKIYKGDTAAAAQQTGDVAHPPFTLGGAGTYFVVAYVQPIIGLTVTSVAAGPITITGNMLLVNPLRTFDEQAEGWPGASTNLVQVGSQPNSTLTLASGSLSGTYTIPASDIINLGYVGVLSLNVSWKTAGSPIGGNILGVSDFLGQTDVLNYASAQYVNAYPEVQIGQPAPNDVFVALDLFLQVDVFNISAISWAPWQKFLPGSYQGQFANFRMQVATTNAQVSASLLAFAVQASVPARIDHYQALALPASGLNIKFRPDGASTLSGFNGGPAGAGLPYVNVTSTAGQIGDVVSITALTLSSVTVQILNAGIGVARSGVNCDVQGY